MTEETPCPNPLTATWNSSQCSDPCVVSVCPGDYATEEEMLEDFANKIADKLKDCPNDGG